MSVEMFVDIWIHVCISICVCICNLFIYLYFNDCPHPYFGRIAMSHLHTMCLVMSAVFISMLPRALIQVTTRTILYIFFLKPNHMH